MNKAYLNLFINEFKNSKLEYKDGKLTGFSYKEIYYLAKASNLKTKSKRKIFKRFKKEFNILMRKGLDLAEKERGKGT